jgi:autotransporter-associated beta strand protein
MKRTGISCSHIRPWCVSRTLQRVTLRGAFYMAVVFLLAAAARGADPIVWTGAGESPIDQVRSWIETHNWEPNRLPFTTEIPNFGIRGDGTVQLMGPQTVAGLTFDPFTTTTINAGGTDPLWRLSLPTGASIVAGEGLRDTNGFDFFASGPRINANILAGNELNIDLGADNGRGSAMLIGGSIAFTAGTGNVINYTGHGLGSSLWITGANAYGAPDAVTVNVNATPIGAMDRGSIGFNLRLADAGRLDNAKIILPAIIPGASVARLGLNESGASGTGNTYVNNIDCNYGLIFADRSYQVPGNETATTINRIESIQGTLVLTGGVIFGSGGGSLCSTNNGYSIRVSHAQSDYTIGALVNNGYLTEGRFGTRCITGPNRLQEPNNYAIVADAQCAAGWGAANFGSGVLIIESANDGTGLSGEVGTAKGAIISLGEHALNTATGSCRLLTNVMAGGVGIRWDTGIDVPGNSPFVFNVDPVSVAGQGSVLDVDLWGHTGGTTGRIDAGTLRIGSSLGGDASFDPLPRSTKHASTSAEIVPQLHTAEAAGYFVGGGGGTLRIDRPLLDWYDSQNLRYVPTTLEMGTTGSVLPGRVALYVTQGDQNQFRGPTNVLAGTLQLMTAAAVGNTSSVHVGVYPNKALRNGIYFHTDQFDTSFPYAGPGMLLINPGQNREMNLTGYATGLGTLANSLKLDGGLIGWTNDVDIIQVPGSYGATVDSNLRNLETNPAQYDPVHVLGLGGEYSAGVMTVKNFAITDNQSTPVLLYKAGARVIGSNPADPLTNQGSILDLTQGQANTYTGGTVIAGGEVRISNANQLNAAPGGTGAPVVISNGGRLRVIANTTIDVPIMVAVANTSGGYGSVVDVDENVTLTLTKPFITQYGMTVEDPFIEKDGLGTVIFAAPFLDVREREWGLKLTEGRFVTGQMPGYALIVSGVATPEKLGGPELEVTGSVSEFKGLSKIVSLSGTKCTVLVDQNGLFRVNGSGSNEIEGTVHFKGNGQGAINTKVVRLLSLAGSSGTGTLTFEGLTAYLTANNTLGFGSLPREAGFTLRLNGDVDFYVSAENNVNGNVEFNGVAAANGQPAKKVRVAGTSNDGSPTGTWTISGTGNTVWAGPTEKFGTGKVVINREQGAPVIVESGASLAVVLGTFDAGGTGDPFTDTTDSTRHVNIVNDATFNITAGRKEVLAVSGGGTTIVWPSSTLVADYIIQDTLSIGAGGEVIIRPSVPDASAAVMGAGTPDRLNQNANTTAEVPEPTTLVVLLGGAISLGLLWLLRLLPRLGRLHQSA